MRGLNDSNTIKVIEQIKTFWYQNILQKVLTKYWTLLNMVIKLFETQIYFTSHLKYEQADVYLHNFLLLSKIFI